MNDDQNSPQTSGINPSTSDTAPDWLNTTETSIPQQPTTLMPGPTPLPPVETGVPDSQMTTSDTATSAEPQVPPVEAVPAISNWAEQPAVEAVVSNPVLVPLAHSTVTTDAPAAIPTVDYADNADSTTSFMEATPILPGTDLDAPLPDIMGETTPVETSELSNNSTVIPNSPSDITPEMMASFLNENKLDIASVPPLPPAAEPVLTEQPKKSNGSWIPILVLALMVVVVAVVIILMLVTSQTTGGAAILPTSSTSSTTQASASSSSETSETISSAESATSTQTISSAVSSLPAYTPKVPAGWLTFTDGFIGLNFALPPQDGYVEVQIPTTPQTVTSEIRQQWLAKPAEWFYAPSSLGDYFGTGINSKTLRLNRAPGRASGISSICIGETYCHIDISLSITKIDFSDALGDLVAKIKAANPNLKITTAIAASVWGGDSITLNVDYGSIQDTAQTKSFTLIKKGDAIFSLDTYTKQSTLITELNTVINAISILP